MCRKNGKRHTCHENIETGRAGGMLPGVGHMAEEHTWHETREREREERQERQPQTGMQPHNGAHMRTCCCTHDSDTSIHETGGRQGSLPDFQRERGGQ